jgi:beta-phosphoglucomutase-like phosphatase (HAD superfamily)
MKYKAVIFDLDGVICSTDMITIWLGKRLRGNWRAF